MSLVIPGIETVHPREVWEPNGIDNWYGTWYLNTYGDLRRDSAFHRKPPAQDLSKIEYVATHYTSAIDLPDGDPDEIVGGVDGIRALLARSHYDYLVNRIGGGYTRLSDGKSFPGYPLGYSFAIDWLGGVWEINGWDYRAAATSGWNTEALAFLMLTDRADPGSSLMWKSHRALSREALRRGAKIAPDRVWSHGWFKERTGKGTATACCGDALEAQIQAGMGDWTKHDDSPEPPPPPAPNPGPTPTPPEGDDMGALIIWSHKGYANAFLLGNGPAINLSPRAFQHYAALGVPQILNDNHPDMLKGVLHQAGMTMLDLDPL